MATNAAVEHIFARGLAFLTRNLRAHLFRHLLAFIHRELFALLTRHGLAGFAWDIFAHLARHTLAARTHHAAAFLARHGRLDILFNNAGGPHPTKPLTELSDEEWHICNAANLDSVFYCCRAAIPAMTAAGFGRIISTASMAGKDGNANQSGYSAAKGGIIGMTLTVARDLAPLGIRAMAIAPGTFLTFAYSSRMTDEQAQAHWGPMVPNPRRMGDPDEYAQLAVQIVENDFLNGTTIRLDGAQRV